MLEEKLRNYVRKASPQTPSEIQDRFAKEMLQAIKIWGSTDPSVRGPLLDQLRRQIEGKLGLAPREIGLTIGFSKKKATNAEIAKESANRYFAEFSHRLNTFRIRKGQSLGQLSFQIDGVDTDHPELVIVNCKVFGQPLRKRDLKHGQGSTRIKQSP